MIIRRMRVYETLAVAALVRRMFDAQIASLFSAQGVATFAAYIDPEGCMARRTENFMTLVAEVEGVVRGMLELRHGDHVSLFFVDEGWQGRGIGRALMREAVAVCRILDPTLAALTVNASPNAVGAYERMGYVATDDAQEMEGVLFTPMALRLDASVDEKLGEE